MPLSPAGVPLAVLAPLLVVEGQAFGFFYLADCYRKVGFVFWALTGRVGVEGWSGLARSRVVL